MVDADSNVMVGRLVEEIAEFVAPEKPLVFDVINVPIIVIVFVPVPNVMVELPAFNIAPERTAIVRLFGQVILKLLVANVPSFTLMLGPVTLVAVIAAPSFLIPLPAIMRLP